MSYNRHIIKQFASCLKSKFLLALIFLSFGTAIWCVITYVYETVLFQQHHLPRPDEFPASSLSTKANLSKLNICFRSFT